MESLVISIVIAAVVVAVFALGRWIPRSLSNLARLMAGEPGSLTPGGFMPGGSRRRRTVELQTVVSRLALVTRLNLPLVGALDAAARGESRPVARILRQISLLVREGHSVSHALEVSVPACPETLTAALRQAEGCGQLTQALVDQERMIAAVVNLPFDREPYARNAILYAGIVIFIVAMMVLWLALFLFPKFIVMFADYDAPLPWMTQVLIDASTSAYPIGALIVLGTIASVLMILAVDAALGHERAASVAIVRAVRSALPITRSIDFGLGVAKAIRMMALGLRSGSPSAFGATLPTVVCRTNHVRRRLSAFSLSVAGGVAPHQAAREARLGDVLVGALRMVERGEDPDRALGHAADYYEAIAYRWWHALAALTLPQVTLALAALVGFVVLALFLPLVSLINHVAESI